MASKSRLITSIFSRAFHVVRLAVHQLLMCFTIQGLGTEGANVRTLERSVNSDLASPQKAHAVPFHFTLSVLINACNPPLL